MAVAFLASPAQPASAAASAAVSAGGFHTCAATMADGTLATRITPVDVAGLTSGMAAVTTGSSHTCALTTAGRLKCWGWSGLGQLGDGATLLRTAPVDVIEFIVGVCGDQNGDGVMSVFDAIIELQIIVGLIEPTETQLIQGDVVRDGVINVFDAIVILQHIVGLTEITECGPAAS